MLCSKKSPICYKYRHLTYYVLELKVHEHSSSVSTNCLKGTELSRSESDSGKSHCHCPGAGHTAGCRADKPVLVLCRYGWCLKPSAPILIIPSNSGIPLTLLLTHRLPGYKEQQQRFVTVEWQWEHLHVRDLQKYLQSWGGWALCSCHPNQAGYAFGAN